MPCSAALGTPLTGFFLSFRPCGGFLPLRRLHAFSSNNGPLVGRNILQVDCCPCRVRSIRTNQALKIQKIARLLKLAPDGQPTLPAKRKGSQAGGFDRQRFRRVQPGNDPHLKDPNVYSFFKNPQRPAVGRLQAALLRHWGFGGTVAPQGTDIAGISPILAPFGHCSEARG